MCNNMHNINWMLYNSSMLIYKQMEYTLKNGIYSKFKRCSVMSSSSSCYVTTSSLSWRQLALQFVMYFRYSESLQISSVKYILYINT